MLIPWQWITISGPSMVPTLRHGDVVIVRHGAPVRPGDVVIATFRSMPDRLVVKRAVRPVDGGWWLASDNSSVAGDSEIYGVADVQARVLLRLRGWRLTSRVRRTPPA
ncbi:MAG: nickel-type superoxide dismutase maturation protease [Jatrophihabitans sp.]|nr:nickel-type superoxide dismutase maturation protease [Jatrophihabitans sp.]